MLYPFAGQKLFWRQKEHVTIKLHGVTSRQSVIFTVTAKRTQRNVHKKLPKSVHRATNTPTDNQPTASRSLSIVCKNGYTLCGDEGIFLFITINKIGVDIITAGVSIYLWQQNSAVVIAKDICVPVLWQVGPKTVNKQKFTVKYSQALPDVSKDLCISVSQIVWSHVFLLHATSTLDMWKFRSFTAFLQASTYVKILLP